MKWILSFLFSFVAISALHAQDTAFITKGFFVTRDQSLLSCAQQQADGRVLISGRFTHFNGETTTNLVRLWGNGNRDTSFNKQAGTDGDIRNMAVQKDGKIFIIGSFWHYMQQEVATGLVRIDSNGVLDQSFNAYIPPMSYGGVKATAIQDDGKLLVTGWGIGTQGFDTAGLIRLNSNGSLDAGFKAKAKLQAYEFINAVCVQKDGKILVGGSFRSWEGRPATGLVRLNANGDRDTSFVLEGDGLATGDTTIPATVYIIRQLPDSSLLIGGSFSLYNGSVRMSVVKLHPDGSLDNGFSQDPFYSLYFLSSVYDIAVTKENKIILGGNFHISSGLNNPPYNDLIVLQQNGLVDTIAPFSGPDPAEPFVATGISRIFVNPDNSFLAFGSFTGVYKGIYQNNLSLYNNQHQIDLSFVNRFQRRGSSIQTIPQADNKILLSGDFNQYGLDHSLPRQYIARLKKDGSLDTAFQNTELNGPVYGMAQQSDSSILAAGSFTKVGSTARNGIARFNKNGVLDNSFDPGAGPDWNVMYCVRPYKDQYIYVTGGFSFFGGTAHKGIVRLFPNGSVDNTFNTSTTPVWAPLSIDVSSNGKVLVAESSLKINPDYTTPLRVYRLMEDGKLDSSFKTPQIGWSMGKKVREGKDGRIYWLGELFQQNNPGNPLQTIICLKQDGSLDSSTRRLPANYVISDFSVLPDSNLIVCGRIRSYMDSTDFVLRLKPDLSIDSSFIPVGLYYWLKHINYTPEGNIVVAVETIPYFRAGNDQIQSIALLRNSSLQIQSTAISGSGIVSNLIDSVIIKQSVDLGNNSVQNFTVLNPSAMDVSLLNPNKIVVSGPDAAEFSVSVSGSSTIVKKGSLPFTISFTPKSEGNKFAIITIPYSNGIDNKYVFVLSGTGTNKVTAVGDVLGESHDVFLYPNPCAIGKVYIRSKKSIDHYLLSDVSGKKIFSGQFASPNSEYKEILLPQLNAGIYFIRLKGKKTDETIKLLVTSK
jgi:uncharacterized delta-60 repeat protein